MIRCFVHNICALLFLPLLAGLPAVYAQPETIRPPGDHPIFTFVQITDPQISSAEDGTALKRAFDEINQMSPLPEFVVMTGDLVDGPGHSELYKKFRQWTAGLHPPVITLPGKTDAPDAFQEVFPAAHRSISHSPFHLLFVNDSGTSEASGNGSGFSDQTVQWMRKELQDVDHSTPLILFSRGTVYRPQSPDREGSGKVRIDRSVLDLLQPYDVRAWFSGNAHANADVRKNGTRYINTASIDKRKNTGTKPGYRIVRVFEEELETSYRPAGAFRTVRHVTQEPSEKYGGTTGRPIRKAVKDAEDGDTISIEPGTYTIRRTIQLKSNLTFTGTEQTVLRLPSPALSSAGVSKGAKTVPVEASDQFREGAQLQFRPPEGLDTFPESEKKKFTASLSSIDNQRLTFDRSLPVPVPAESRIGYFNNIFQRRGTALRNITFRNLNFHGGRIKRIPDLHGHVDRCAILFSAKYTYADGPQGPPNRNIRVVNCDFRNFYGRPVAFYSAVDCLVENCTMNNVNDESINFDHFTFRCRAIGNTVRDSKIGVTINDGSYNVVRHNRFYGCGKAVNLWWWRKCPQNYINIRNTIRQNVVRSPRHDVSIRVSRRAYWNKITENSVEGDIRVREQENTVHNNERK